MLNLQPFDTKPTSETLQLAFDFVLPAGESLSSAVVTSSVWSGVDASPSAILGTVSLASPQVKVVVTGGVAGCIYLLEARATLSSGRVLVRQGFLAIAGIA